MEDRSVVQGLTDVQGKTGLLNHDGMHIARIDILKG